MHIVQVSIYSRAGKLESIDLVPGSLNIITGDSRTGKSSLINIIRYCLGSDSPYAPAGPIQTQIAWFGLIAFVGDTTFFVGRPAVPPNKTTSAAMLVIGAELAPAFEELSENTNATAVRDYIGGLIGLEDNLNVPPEGQTRRPLSAGLVHALFYCFQSQGEIANPDILFHHQTRDFVPQAIKDTLPYFIGAQGVEDLRQRERLQNLRRDLRRAQQLLRQSQAEIEGGLVSGTALINEARDAGLYVDPNDPSSNVALRDALVQIVESPARETLERPRADEFELLQSERRDLVSEVRDLDSQVRTLDEFATATGAYSRELNEQSRRLSSIGLIPADEVDQPACVVCGQDLGATDSPSYEQIELALGRLNRRLQLTSRDTPRIENSRSQLLTERRQRTARIAEINEALGALADTDERIRGREGQLNLQSYVRGRVSRYLDEVGGLDDPELSSRQARVDELTERVGALEDELDPDALRARVTSILAVISRQMTELAGRLQLEHADEGIRIDINRLTVVADTAQGPAYMNTGEIGSGMNWVGYHLSAYLALHQFYINRSRPVPRFVVFDQPSQAFFPRDRESGGDVTELSDSDRENTRRLFRLLYDVAEELRGQLQIIVLDHADFENDWFQNSVVARWRTGEPREALVPRDWL